MKKTLLVTLLLTALVSSTAFYLFPQFTDQSAKVNVAISFSILVPQIVAIWAFLTSLTAFKQDLRPAYYLLVAAIVFISLPLIQLPLISFVAIDPILLAWCIALSSLIGGLLMYLSMHKFARVLELKSRPWGSFWFAVVFAVTFGLLSTLLPHLEFGISEGTINGIFGSYIMAAGFALVAAVLAWAIRGKLGPAYKAAMAWLVVGLAVLAFSSVHETLVRLLPALTGLADAWYTTYGVSLLPLFVVAVCLLCSSLQFKKLSQEHADLPENATYLDVINYVASLASNPKAIDVTLDKVREITATTTSDSELSPANKATLIQVYLRLETHLTTKEQVLKLTKEELRARLPAEFQQQLPAR